MDNIGNTIQSILSSPDSINQIANIAKTFGTESTTDSSQKTNPSSSAQSEDLLSVLNQIDPNTISTVAGVIREYNNTDDRRFSLLNALRPYLQGNDAGHIDKAMQIMRLSKVIKHVFSSGTGGGTNV